MPSLPDTRADDALMRAVCRGDKGAFSALLVRYQTPLYAFCWRMVRDDAAADATAEDMVQDVFTKLWQYPDRYQAGKGAVFKTWLFQVAKNHTLSHLRKIRPYAATIDMADMVENMANVAAPDETGPEATLLATERAGVLAKSLDKLSALQQRLIALFYMERQSQRAIGEALHLTPRQVEGQLHRAREKLRDGLSDRKPPLTRRA